MRISMLFLALLSPALSAQVPSAPAWVVSSAPTVLIGDESDPHKQFQRIVSVARFPDGAIVVANGATNELRVFSAQADYVRSLSGTGNGPGELRSLGGFFRAGDTLVASESGLGPSNVHYFTTAGFISRVVLKSTGSGGVVPVGRFPDGHLVVMSGFRVVPERPIGTIYDDTVSLGVMASLEAAKPEWIGGFPGFQILLYESPNRPGRPAPVTYTFGHFLGRAVSGDRLWVGDSHTGAIAQYNSSGKLVAQFKAPIVARPFRADAIARARQRLLDQATNPAGRARIEALYAAQRPATAPLFTQFIAGYDGEVWIKMYEEDPAAPPSFVILDSSGRLRGRVNLAARFSLYDVGQDYVLGVLQDEDGVERVASYRLERR